MLQRDFSLPVVSQCVLLSVAEACSRCDVVPDWTFLLPASDHKELQGSEQQHKHDAIDRHYRC